jgi:hypothetical protein
MLDFTQPMTKQEFRQKILIPLEYEFELYNGLVKQDTKFAILNGVM